MKVGEGLGDPVAMFLLVGDLVFGFSLKNASCFLISIMMSEAQLKMKPLAADSL